jgi:cytochrome P450 family 12
VSFCHDYFGIFGTDYGNCRQGEEWHKMRSVVNPILMQPRFVKNYIPTIDGIVNDFMQNIPSLQDDKGEMPANFSEYLNRWSLESITAIVLEKRLGLMDLSNKTGDGEKIAKAVRKILVDGMEFELKPTIWRVYETKAFKELMGAYNELTE